MERKFSKKFIAFVVCAILLVVGSIAAAIAVDYKGDDNITWTFNVNSDGTTATLTGARITKQTSKLTIPSTVISGDKTYTVTSIANNAFKSNNSINPKNVFGELTIPDTITSIGSSAFENTYIFGKVIIPESVTSIGSSAFKNCDGLTEVLLSSKVKTVAANTFEGCYALNKINLDNVTRIESSAFSSCQALHYVEIGKSTTFIGTNAFNECDALGGIIDTSAITNELQNDAFKNCDRIEGFIIPDAENKINFGAYNGCNGIQGYYTTEKNEKYLSVDGVLFSKDGKTLLKYPTTKSDTKYTIGDNVTTIGANAFSGTLYLEEIVIGKGVTKLNDSAFAGSSINFAYIPDNVKVVGFDAFKGCTKLRTVVFGKGVELIGAGALSGANGVRLVIIGNDMATPPATNGNCYYASDYICTEHKYGYEDKAPTCTESGYNRCILCQRYEYVKATNHSGAVLEQVNATCKEDGYRIVDCFGCGQTVKAITTPATGHVSDGHIYTIPARYMSPEVKYSTCIICNEMYVYKYNANFLIIGDVNCDGKIDETDFAVLLAYIADNSAVTEISTNNANINHDKVIDMEDAKMLRAYLNGELNELPQDDLKCNNHSWKNTLQITKASCETQGFRIRYCSSCGILTDELVTPQLEHTLTNTTVINPSCTAVGQRISFCTTCNKTVIETLDKLQHTRNWYTVGGQRGYEYSTCKVCGALESRTVDYTVFETLLEQIPKYYKVYYQPETLHLIEPVLENYKCSLTQDEVNENVNILAEALRNARFNVFKAPTVFIETPPTSQSQDYISSSIFVAYMDEDGKPVVEAVDYNGQVKVRGRGSSGWSGKLPYNIKFSSKVDLFGMGAGKKYCLLSNKNDETLIRNALTFELSYLLGIKNSAKYTIVDLYAGGTYAGSYMMTTPMDVGEDRIEIDEETDFLLEIEKEWDGESDDQEKCYLVNTPIYGIRAIVNNPEKEDMSAEAYSKLWTSVAQIDFAIRSGDWETIQTYIDVDSVARYYILHEMLKEIDIIWDSTRFCITNGKLTGGPAWDFDYAMFWDGMQGGTAFSEQAYYKNNSGNVCEGGVIGKSSTGVWASVTWYCPDMNSTSDRIWFCSLYKHSPDFVKLVCRYVAEFNDELTLMYESEYNDKGKLIRDNVIDSIILDDENEASIIRNRNKFGVLKQTYDTNIKNLRNWLKERNEWMQEFYAAKLKELE